MGFGVVSGVGLGVGTGVALGVGEIDGVALGLGEPDGEGFGRRRGFLLGVAPAFWIVFPVFSIPLPTVRAVAFAPFFTVSPVSLAAFFTAFSAFWTGVGSAPLRAKGKANAAKRVSSNFLIRFPCRYRDRFSESVRTQFAIG
jgi:hypothetical protein